MHIIGIDNSGNYSRLVAIDPDGRLIGHHIGNSANLNQLSRDTVRDNIKKLILEFNRLTNTKYEDCAAICIGASCINNAGGAMEMEKLLGELGIDCPVKAVTEMDIVLAAECGDKAGIVIYSGIDSCGYALDKKKAGHRIGGYGHLIDSGGSGYWIGIQAIKASLRSYDGRGPKTSITEKMLKSFRISEVSRIFEFIYSEKFNKAVVSELASIVKNAAAEGDETAEQIENMAASELFLLADALINRYELRDCSIVLCGSVLQSNERLREKMSAIIGRQYGDISVKKLSKKPELGAAFLALALYEDESP